MRRRRRVESKVKLDGEAYLEKGMKDWDEGTTMKACKLMVVLSRRKG